MSDDWRREQWHPVLQPMRCTVERWFDRNDLRAWDVLTALAIANGLPAFNRESVQAVGA